MLSRFYATLRRLIAPSSASVFEQAQIDSAAEDCRRIADLETLPNDLTRMLYLASLRDCNSGLYLHPELSRSLGVKRADEVLSACHNKIFSRLSTVPLSGYVLQIEEYIRYSRAERNTLLKTWRSLKAYRATVPVSAPALSSELFCLNIEQALSILEGPPDTFDRSSD